MSVPYRQSSQVSLTAPERQSWRVHRQPACTRHGQDPWVERKETFVSRESFVGVAVVACTGCRLPSPAARTARGRRCEDLDAHAAGLAAVHPSCHRCRAESSGYHQRSCHLCASYPVRRVAAQVAAAPRLSLRGWHRAACPGSCERTSQPAFVEQPSGRGRVSSGIHPRNKPATSPAVRTDFRTVCRPLSVGRGARR
jgi:hypothetical protein